MIEPGSEKVAIHVFVSSAMRELEYEREAAEEALSQLRFEPGLFELLPALSASEA